MMRDVLDYIECEVCGVEFAAWDTHQCKRADPRPCRGENGNICAAEGCYGEACRKEAER